MSWLTKNYPVGKKVQVPHPQKNRYEEAEITSHTVDKSANSFSNNPNGVMVKFIDGVYFEISQGYLNEDGSGLS